MTITLNLSVLLLLGLAFLGPVLQLVGFMMMDTSDFWTVALYYLGWVFFVVGLAGAVGRIGYLMGAA